MELRSKEQAIRIEDQWAAHIQELERRSKAKAAYMEAQETAFQRLERRSEKQAAWIEEQEAKLGEQESCLRDMRA